MDSIAIILASGAGTRMMSDVPKPLHRVLGTTMAEYALRAVDQLATLKLMTVGYKRALVEQELHGQAEFIYQDKKDGWGTADAVMRCMDYLKGKSGSVIVTSCDKPLVLYETYARLADEVSRGASCAMLTDIADNPFGYSRIVRRGGRVVKSARLGQLSGDELMIKEIDASVYCFDIESLVKALEIIKCDSGEYHLSDVIEAMSGMGLYVTTVPPLEKCECLGVNDRLQLSQAEKAMRWRVNSRLMRQGVTIIDPEGTSIEPNVTIGRDSIVYPGSRISSSSVIGSGCTIIASDISASHIGQNSRIEYSVISDCDLPMGSKIGPFVHKTRAKDEATK